MSENSSRYQLKLDPWAASSLLQKAIRRGETELALDALSLLHRYRGEAVWRRLLTIAVEDVGIADLDLLSDVVRLGADKPLRSVLGFDADLLNDLCRRLAEAPKDRSADYLFSAASVTIRSWAFEANFFERDQSLPQWKPSADIEDLVQSAVDALLFCTSGRDEKLRQAPVEQFIRSCGPFPAAIEEIVIRLAGIGAHAFSLMLLPLWSAVTESSPEPHVSTETLPEAEYERGIPLCTFDKHVAVGKIAISRFARDCLEVRQVLTEHVPQDCREQVALIAAFYADAAPVARKLVWERTEALYVAGLEADMIIAGCPQDAAHEIVDSVTRHLLVLNDIRRAVLAGRWQPHE